MADLVDCIRQCDLEVTTSAALTCIQSCIFALTRCDLDDFQGARDISEGWLPSWLSLALAIALIPATGLFAGLTIGLLSLDNVSLRVYTPTAAKLSQHVKRRERSAELLSHVNFWRGPP